VSEPTRLQCDAANVIVNLPNHHVIDALATTTAAILILILTLIVTVSLVERRLGCDEPPGQRRQLSQGALNARFKPLPARS
jgi:hypothetical protein